MGGGAGRPSFAVHEQHSSCPADMTHAALITSESGAAESSKAILDVVAAVRTDSALD